MNGEGYHFTMNEERVAIIAKKVLGMKTIEILNLRHAYDAQDHNNIKIDNFINFIMDDIIMEERQHHVDIIKDVFQLRNEEPHKEVVSIWNDKITASLQSIRIN